MTSGLTAWDVDLLVDVRKMELLVWPGRLRRVVAYRDAKEFRAPLLDP